MRKLVGSMVAMCLLAACGGGGGDSGWLTFEPSSLSATLYEGESMRLSLTGTANSEPSEIVNVGVFVDGSLFDPESVSVENGPDEMSLTFRADLLPTLSVGTHNGSIEVRACLDDPEICSSPYDKGTWRVPVRVQVQADPGNPTTPANGAFTTNTVGWEEYEDQPSGAAMSLSATGGEMRVSITNGGTQFYHLQVSYRGINLEEGRTYSLSFDARADSARTIWASVHDGGRDLNGDGNIYWTYIPGVPNLALTTSMQTFTYEFTMPETNRMATVDFFVGGSDADVYLDNVTVTEIP